MFYAQQPWFVNGNTNAQLGGSLTPSIGTNQNRPLLFETNNINRQIIRNGGTTNADGRTAMGNNLAVGFIPRSRLHLHQTAAVNAIRFTTDNMAGGIGFEVGYNATSNIANQQFAEVNNRENTAMLTKKSHFFKKIRYRNI